MNNYTIVSVNVSEIVAAAPSNLQQTGCIVSLGGTTIPVGTAELITQASDYTALESSTPNAELTMKIETFFAQGNTQSVYILELGKEDTVPAGVAALKAYIQSPSIRMYAYQVPNAWDGAADFVALTKLYASNTAMTYFFVDTESIPATGSTSVYATVKSVVWAVSNVTTESPSTAILWAWLNTKPSETNKLAPFAFRYVYDVTPLAQKNGVKQAIGAAYGNYVGTGAEGGISNTILFGGMAADGKELMQWYAVDWIQIQAAQALANAVINGSNNAQNPLYYQQTGINTLQAVVQSTMNSATAFGISNGTPTVSAIAFLDYIKANPNDYGIGLYSGLAVTVVPNRGFKNIVFNLTVDFSGSSLLSTAATA